ncbi:MAG: DNA mismatch repair protein MutS [Fusicatenibacter sp.]|nr:DNA mismatch repair protein MutS [Fusicatenibacter sp.]
MDTGYQEILPVAVLIAAAMVLMIRENHSQKKRRRKRIVDLWGTIPHREYQAEELACMADYARRKYGESLSIDDITWNDLNMDLVYQKINHSMSACGDEYLYCALRMPELDETVLNERERLISYFDCHEKERVLVQEALDGIGRIYGYSISDYIDAIRNVPKRSRKKYFFLSASALVGIAFLFVWPAIGMMVFISFLTINVIVHSRESGRIDACLKSLMCVLRILRTAGKLGKMEIPELSDYLLRLQVESRKMRGIRKKCITLIHTRGMDGDLASMLSSYFNTFFLFDFISFYSVIRDLKQNSNTLTQMISDIGVLDFAISVASYRKSLPFYCIPEYVSNGRIEEFVMDLEDLYHPLLMEPVANSICAKRGILITGSNASGKSTFLKSVALNAILAQSIDTSLSHSYQSVMCRVMTSMALRDDIENGESYYIVEIRSVKRILDQSRKKEPLLCVIDEVFRGTNTVERIAASSQVLFSLRKPQVLCFAATHDIELTYILEELYTNYHFEEKVTDQDVEFDYLLKEGRAVGRNAIALLSVMGYEREIVEGAKKAAARFEENGIWEQLNE